MYEIARLVLPSSEFADYADLFVRREEACCRMNGCLANTHVYRFNTWMNLLAARKYDFYCELGDIYVKLEAEGSYRLQVVGANRNAAFGSLEDILVEADCEGSCCIRVPGARAYEAVSYSLIEDKAAPVRLRRGAWCTDKAPLRENKLAIVICTFRREAYVKNNMALFERFMDANPALEERIKLIVVDNGRTLDASRSNERVRIIPNMNAGGAGGFTRGLIDVIEQDAGFTRVLFMDDDVEICPESFFKTLALSDYLKEEYSDAFINGAMLSLYDKRTFHENLALRTGFSMQLYHDGRELDYLGTMEVNDIPDDVFHQPNARMHSAWWYQCFALSLVREKGLPLPVFFREDDVEWCWRHHGKPHISMNGICVWHAPFAWRVARTSECYYQVRNMFLLHTLYTGDFRQNAARCLQKKLDYLLRTYDYVALELLLRACRDILKGSAVFRENPDAQFSEICAINNKLEWYPCESEAELQRARSPRRRPRRLQRLVYRLSNHGLYCPELLFRKKSYTLDWFPSVMDFALVKEVRVYNLFTHKYHIRRFNRSKSTYFRKEGKRLIQEIEKNYDRLHEDFCRAHAELSSMSFWKDYLKI